MEPSIEAQFGLVTVKAGPFNKNGRRWTCQCACGKKIERNVTQLRKAAESGKGGCQSCSGKRHGHGKTSDPTWAVWQAIKQRCLNERHSSYPDYGGRGIKVCQRWLDSFEGFLSDMSVRPEGTSIDRKNPNGNYEPDNCRWATFEEQQCNKRNSASVVADGVSYPTFSAACRAFGMKVNTAKVRVLTYGWTVERALKTPINTKLIRKDVLARWAKEGT